MANKVFDLIHKVTESTESVESHIPFEDEGNDNPTPPPVTPKQRTKLEMIFFYLLLFAIFFIMGAVLISPNLFKKSATTTTDQTAETAPSQTTSPVAGFSIDKDGQSTEEAAAQLGVGSPTPTPSTEATAAPTATTAATAAPAASTNQAAKIQIMNGTSREGAASALRTKLSQSGIVVASIGNYYKRTVARTTIFYDPDYKTAAEQVHAITGGILSESAGSTGSNDILIVIGKTN